MNIHVGRIARRQATIGGFALKATPSPPSVNSNSDDEDGDDDDAFEEDDDGDTSSTNEMSTWHSTLCHSWQKGGVVLVCEGSHT